MAKHNQIQGIQRIWNAAGYSITGLRAAWAEEAAFRQESLLCLIMLPAAFLVGQTSVERILLVTSCLLVLVVELLNSAIEATVDRIGADRHKLSGRAKDMGSAAVLVSLAIVVVCWGLIGWENLVT